MAPRHLSARVCPLSGNSGQKWILACDGLSASLIGRSGSSAFKPSITTFQTIHHCSVDVAHGLVLLFGIGTRGPSTMGFENEAEQSSLIGRSGSSAFKPSITTFQTIHHCSVDVAHGLVLLFGIGTRG